MARNDRPTGRRARGRKNGSYGSSQWAASNGLADERTLRRDVMDRLASVLGYGLHHS